MIKKLLFALTISVVVCTTLFSQPINITVLPPIGKVAQCPNSTPIITCNFISGTGTSVVNGELVCTDPCGTTILQIEIDNVKWNQGPDINWIHGVVFGGASTAFTFLSSDLAPANWFFGTGCTGACPTGGQIAGGAGWYFRGGGQSCCAGGPTTPNPCDNWGDNNFSCNGSVFRVRYTVQLCNSALRGIPLYTDLYLYSDGNTGCWNQPDVTSNILSFTIPNVGCPTLYSPLPTATPRLKTCTPALNYTTTLSGGCGNSNTITWWTASVGGTQIGTGSPFVYDPPGTACPQGTLYAACCPVGNTCASRRAFAVPGACAAALSIDNVTTTNPACPSQCGNITATTISGASGVVTYTLMPDNITNTTGIFTCITGANHTLTAVDASGCSASYNVIFTIPVCGFPLTAPVSYCQNAPAVPLTATLSGTGTNLQWYTALTGGSPLATAPTPSTAAVGATTYYVTQMNAGVESTPRTPLVVTVLALPAAPIVTTPVVYCQNVTASALAATGTNLLWYSTATGGTGTTTVPTPSTTTPGSTTYYVSQTVGTCESPRSAIVVNITATPLAPVVAPISYCQNTLGVGALTAIGTNLLWYTTATGGIGSTTAPTPSTIGVGVTTYYVSQTVSGCESPRAAIIVTINIRPAAPAIVTPVLYCQNDVAIPLTATGTNLLWYSTATGGTGLSTAPTPITTVIGSTIYYVSQTIGTCESPRSAITVTITPPPASPIVVTPVGYCQNATSSQLTATGSNLLWYANATGGTGSAIAPTPSTLAPGSVTYYVSQTSGTCESPRSAIVVNITATPSAPVVAPVSYCQGATGAVALFASGTNLLWYTTATGGVGSTIAPIPFTTTAGNTTYYVSQTVSGCESLRSALVVTINPTPGIPVVVTPLLYCQNDVAVPLTATGTNLLWYTTATGGLGTAVAPTPITTAVGSTTYYVSSTLGTCEGVRTPLVVTITTPPSAPAVVTPLVYCQGFVAPALTAVGSNLLWYTTATGGTGSTIAPVPSTISVGSTTYYVSQTSGSCESSRSAIVVTINTTPAAPNVVSPISYCQNATGIPALTASGTNLLWYTTATGGVGTAIAPTPATTTVGITTYYVSSTIGICESPRTPLLVTINITPAAPIVNAAIQYCQFTSAIALTATGTNLLWYTTATGGVGSTIAPIPLTTAIGTTIYYVSSTIGICEGPRAAITVTINPEPLAPVVITPETYCQGVTASALNAIGSNLLWYTTPTGGTGSFVTPTPSTTTVGTTNYYVTQTIGGCTSPRANIVVVINPTPTSPIVSTPVIYCQGATAIALFASGSNLLWYTTASGGVGSTITPIPLTTTTGNTIYYVSQSNSFCESPRSAIMVTINPTPLAPTVTTPIVYCQNATSLPLSATGSNLLWYTTATGGTGSSTAPIPSTSMVGNTNYYVSQSIGICEGSRTLIAVNITALPAAPVVTTPVTYCQNASSSTLTATGTNLLWYNSATGGTSIPAPTPSTVTSGSTIYYVSQTVNNCEGPRAAITVTVNPTPALPIVVSPIAYCQNAVATALSATGNNLLWYTTATGGVGTATAPTPLTTSGGSTTYYVSQTLLNCEGPRSPIVVNVTATPSIPGVTSPVVYCQNAIATALTATGANLLWYTTATGGIGSSIAPIPLTTATGNTIYYVSQSINNCEGPRTPITVTINTTPTAPAITTPVEYCQGAIAVPLTATGTNLLWYTTVTGGIGTNIAPTPSTTNVGNTIYYVSQTTGICEGPRAALTVTINITPAAPSATSPVAYCQGASATTLLATGTNLTWYTVPTGGVGSPVAPTPIITIAGSTTYYVSSTVGICEGPRKAIIVNITGTPAAPVIISPVVYCQGKPAISLTATGTNLLWYTTATGGTGTTIAPTPSTALVGSTLYYVSQSVNGCEGPRAAITVTINTTPVAPTVSALPVVYCQNTATVALTAIGTNLLWYTTATGGVGSVTAPIPLSTTAGNTTYYVSQTVGICEGPRAAIMVTINATPALPGGATTVAYCQNAIATALTATGANLLWYTSATGGVGSTTAPTPSTVSGGVVTYYVSQTILNCEGPRKAIVVTVTVTPTLPTVISPVTYCQSLPSLALTAGGTNLLWYTTATGGVGSTTAPTPSTTIGGSTTYYVSQSTNGCEGPRSAITIIVNPTPALPTVLDRIYCQNTATTALTATGANLLWYTSATGGIGNAVAPIPSSATAGITTYYVSQTALTCEGPRAAITVNITATPLAPIVISPLTYCPNDPALQLTAPGTNLLWYSNAIGGTGSTIAPTPSTTAAGTFTFYVSQSTNASPTLSCEGPRAAIVVNVNNNNLTVNIGVDTTICEGESVKFTPSVLPSAISYEWRAVGVPNSTIDIKGNKDVTVNPVDNAQYILKATNGGCSTEDTVNVFVRWKPILDAGPNKAICLNDRYLLVANLTHFNSNKIDFAWSPTDSLATTNTLQTIANPIISTWYKITATTTKVDYGCDFVVSDSMKLVVQPIIKAFAGNDTIAVKGVSHQLTGTGGLNYTWSTPSGATITNPFAQKAFAILNNDANFYLKVTDAVGCTGYDSIFVKVYDGPTYYVPNAFTPNGDGMNDIFRAIPVGMSNTTYFRVFNRYGNLMFETTQWLKGWDGTFSGKPQPTGTYVWMVSGTDKNYKKVEMKGTVNLIR